MPQQPRPKLLIDVQDDGKPRLWIDHECLKTYHSHTFWAGKPLEQLMVLEAALVHLGIFPKVETPELEG